LEGNFQKLEGGEINKDIINFRIAGFGSIPGSESGRVAAISADSG
jgi:hypothetical protein